MRVFKTQRNKKGNYINHIVETKARVIVLQFIREKFRDYGEFVPFTLNEYLDEKLGYYHREDVKEIAKEKERIKRLVKAGWLKKPDKEKRYDATKKYKNYLNRFFCFDNPSGPLMRSKEPKEKIVEKKVEKETKEIKKEEIAGFV